MLTETVQAPKDSCRPAYNEAFKKHDRIISCYLKPDLSMLDDIGMKYLPKRSGKFLFEINMRGHRLRSMMMTSNRPLKD